MITIMKSMAPVITKYRIHLFPSESFWVGFGVVVGVVFGVVVGVVVCIVVLKQFSNKGFIFTEDLH